MTGGTALRAGAEKPTPPPAPQIVTDRLAIELAVPAHAALHAAFFARNRAHFARWDPPRGAVESESYWAGKLAQSQADFEYGCAVPLVVLPRLAGRQSLIGRINFTQIARGPFQSCMLGFAVDGEHEGRGLMFEALAASIDWVFSTLSLHRVQAGYRPENSRSGRLLQRLGFEEEGLSRRYLFIDGAWRDHVITARLNPRFDDSVFSRAGEPPDL